MPVAILIEIIVTRHFPRAITFPFLKSFLEQHGFIVRWLRFAYESAPKSNSTESAFELPQEDVEKVLSLVREHESSPLFVLFSHRPSEFLARAFAEAKAQVGWICDERTKSHSIARPLFPDITTLASFFGLSWHGGPNLFEEVTPDFRFEPANPDALSAPPLPYIICGPDCTYRRSLASNPFFEGLDVWPRRVGCTFCKRPEQEAKWTKPPEDIMARQLMGIGQAFCGAREPLLVRAIGESFIKKIEAFAALVVSTPLPPCEFLLDGRADLILAREKHLLEAIKILEGSPHKFHVALVGIENFSDSELLRFNKGIRAVQNLRLVRLLLALERDFPKSFGFRQWGGLSLILFTPWTRPQDLAINLSAINIARIEALSGKIFSGKLRLMPELPLYWLAERDGLLDEEYKDPRLDVVRSKAYASLYPDEKPWHFQDPRTEAVCRVMMRVDTERIAEDEIASRIAEAERSFGPLGTGFGLALIDAQCSSEEVLEPQTLIARAEKFLVGDPQACEVRDLRGTPMDPMDSVELTLLAVRNGIKPVARLEGLAGVELSALGLQSAVVNLGVMTSVFVARDATLLEQAAEAAKRQLLEPTNRQAARMEEGRLLGYPECCIRAFQACEGEILDNYVWLYVQRRVDAKDEVSPLLNPAYLLCGYIPCSLYCEASLERAEKILHLWGEQKGAERARKLVESLSHPWLFFVETESRVELVPLQEPGERFRYEPGLWSGDNPLVRLVLSGEEVVFDETGVTILKGGRVYAALGCRAFVWWHRRCFQRDFWKALIELRFEPRPGPQGPRDQNPEEKAQEPRSEKSVKLAAFLARALRSRFEGFVVTSVQPLWPFGACIVLRSAEEQITLHVVSSSQVKTAFARIGPLALIHPDSCPLDSPSKVRAARSVAATIARALKKRNKQ